MNTTSLRHQHSPSQSVLRSLDSNWAVLNADTQAAQHVRQWATAVDELVGVETPDDVFDAIANASGPGQDKILRHLVERTQAGDKVAEQVLVKSMEGKLVSITHRMTNKREENYDWDEAIQRVIWSFCESVHHLVRIPNRRIAGRLALDTLNKATDHLRHGADASNSDVISLDAQPGDDHGDWNYMGDNLTQHHHHAHSPTDDWPAADEREIIGLLRWMKASGQFADDDVKFLGELYLLDDGRQAAAAQRLGVTGAAVRQRLCRLRSALRDALTEAGTSRDHLTTIAG